MGLNIYPPVSSGGAVWGDITGSVSAQTDLTTAFGTQGIKKYVALLTQSGTNAPVATVLENSLGGTLVWTYEAQGSYLGTLNGAFTLNKTHVLAGTADAVTGFVKVPLDVATVDGITIQTYVVDEGADGQMTKMPIQILVYP